MNCLYCGKELTNRQTKYCSPKCQQAYQAQQKIEAWEKGEFDGMKGTNSISNTIRHFLLEQAGYKCERCGWGEINPFTNLVALEIHHKDGDYRNNTKENLEVLCPNCHSLTPNYKALNKEGREERVQGSSRKNYCIDCGTPISDKAIRCKICAGKARITEKPILREELKTLIRTTPFTKIAEKYHVSDKAVSKWCLQYKLPNRKKDIKQYTDEEWEAL